jgi:hypothetical protein
MKNNKFFIDTRQKVEPLALSFVNKQQKSGDFA